VRSFFGSLGYKAWKIAQRELFDPPCLRLAADLVRLHVTLIAACGSSAPGPRAFAKTICCICSRPLLAHLGGSWRCSPVLDQPGGKVACRVEELCELMTPNR
jgi:hypothetical protein